MSKIICDVCGTSFPESASQCPICGCVRLGDVNVISKDTVENTGTKPSYTYVKGGRFSKSNVKKRNSGLAVPAETAKKKSSGSQKKVAAAENGSTALIIIAVILLFSIIAMVIYIATHLLQKYNSPVPQSEGTQQIQQDETKQDIPCTGITLNTVSLLFTEVGQTDSVKITLLPADTTDQATYTSKDTDIVIVDPTTGLVTAVANGETSIEIVCGEKTAVCNVFCNFEVPDDSIDETEDNLLDDAENNEVVDDSENDSTDVTPPVTDAVYRIDNVDSIYDKEFTLDPKSSYTARLQLVDENGTAVAATWSAENASILSVSVSGDGLVAYVSHMNVLGNTNVVATYGGNTYTCKVTINN